MSYRRRLLAGTYSGDKPILVTGLEVLDVFAAFIWYRAAADSVAAAFQAVNSKGLANNPAGFYDMHIRDAHKQERYAGPPAPSGTALRNCTARTFDPANQAEVEFVGCRAAPGGEGFRDAGYSEPGRAFQCVSADGTATVWDSGDGDEGNAVRQAVSFPDAAGGARARP